MKSVPLTAEQIETLDALASGVIPADAKDRGVAGMSVGQSLARKIQTDPNGSVYVEAIEFAVSKAKASFGKAVGSLDPAPVEALLVIVRDRYPGLFKLLRAEACAIYLSQPSTWERIGFPGPSIEKGGYPEFDQRPGPIK